MRPALLVLAILTLTLSVDAARTHKITLEIYSNPGGAQVWSMAMSGATLVPSSLKGTTPLALTYELAGDCGQTEVVRVRWASGAETSAPVTLCAKTGKRQHVMFDRPADVAGLEVDLQVAYQQAVLAQLQAQTAALDYSAWLQSLTAGQRAVAAPKPFALCVSRDVARGVIYVACQ